MLPLRIVWYNRVLRHWHNWRMKRRWLADPQRPAICPRAGAISQQALDWAESEAAKIEAWKATNTDWEKQLRPRK